MRKSKILYRLNSIYLGAFVLSLFFLSALGRKQTRGFRGHITHSPSWFYRQSKREVPSGGWEEEYINEEEEEEEE
jgi:hypothetical protein